VGRGKRPRQALRKKYGPSIESISDFDWGFFAGKDVRDPMVLGDEWIFSIRSGWQALPALFQFFSGLWASPYPASTCAFVCAGWDSYGISTVPVLADTLLTLLVLSECEGSPEGLSIASNPYK